MDSNGNLRGFVRQGKHESLDAALEKGSQRWRPDTRRKIIEDLWILNQDKYTAIVDQTFCELFGSDVQTIGSGRVYGRVKTNGDSTIKTTPLRAEELVKGHSEASKRAENYSQVSNVLLKYVN